MRTDSDCRFEQPFRLVPGTRPALLSQTVQDPDFFAQHRTSATAFTRNPPELPAPDCVAPAGHTQLHVSTVTRLRIDESELEARSFCSITQDSQACHSGSRDGTKRSTPSEWANLAKYVRK
jgi:hypothetical protein